MPKQSTPFVASATQTDASEGKGKQTVHFRNRFGSASVTPIAEPLAINGLSSSNPIAQANMIDMETAEKLALISDNKRIQILFEAPFSGRAFVVLHGTPKTSVAICRVRINAFACAKSPSAMLEELVRGTYVRF